MSLIPTVCYTIWFTQRTGSTWLCEALSSTGVAGRPGEFLMQPSATEALVAHNAKDRSELLDQVYELGSSANGVFGIKQGYREPAFGDILDALADPGPIRLARWEAAFPNHRHIFMTRRNKLRLAVSWWRAIKSGEWHRRRGENPVVSDLSDEYDAVAIDTLMQQAVVREAGIQELFSEAGIVPLQIVYEDAVSDPGATVNGVLDLLGLPSSEVNYESVTLEPTADDVTEEWVQRFRNDRQAGWDNRGW